MKQFWRTVSQHNLPLIYNRNTEIDILSQEPRHKEDYGVIQVSPAIPVFDPWIRNDCTKIMKARFRHGIKKK